MAGRTYDVSAAALKPLMKMFWGTQGWRNQPAWPDAATFQRSVDAGLMFTERVVIDHDECVKAAKEAVAEVTLAQVSEAFVASLTSERLDLRSALGSYAVARYLPEHPFTAQRDLQTCAVCAQLDRSHEDLNRLNFERFKWGGLQRDNIFFVAFDLEQFLRAPVERPTGKSIEVGRRMIQALRNAPANATAGQVAAGLKAVKGSTPEREALLDILGVCGILRTAEHSGYATGFVPAAARKLPRGGYAPRAYPVCWWQGSDRVDDEALQMFLPMLAG